MKRCCALLVVSLCALLGCAPAIAPLPPTAMPIPDSPEEYRAVQMQWKANTVITHNVQTFQEVRLGDDVKTSEEHHVVRLNTAGFTAQGHVRVRLTYDGTVVGVFVLDQEGQLVDALAIHPAHKEAFQLFAQGVRAVSQEDASKTFRRGEPVHTTVPIGAFLQAFPPEFRPILAEGIPREVTFQGYVRLSGTDAVAFTSRTLNLFGGPFYLRANDKRHPVWLEDASYVEYSYYDAVGGYVLAIHSETVVRAHSEGRYVSVRGIRQQTLDRTRSSGL